MAKCVQHIGQALAQQIDVELMGASVGFTLDQLVESAGLAVALSVARVYPLASHPRILVVAGPGNNGLDGLVAARHLALFRYSPSILCPKRPDRPLFQALYKQCTAFGIPFVDDIHSALAQTDLIVDGIFGFSFDPRSGIRAPFDQIIAAIKASSVQVVSIDVPSAWDVEKGNTTSLGIEPETLVSLTLPKLGVKNYPFKHHFLGGRFVPPKLCQSLGFEVPEYPCTDLIVDLNTNA